ncbi:glycosyltransferase family 90 protein [Trichoderma citrinoviride]|uniref:Glycosyltransferase family 90 protein n=1 Tax=Trichoderma citrinoviride TaxID=58853 RepID=A0A2T4AY79_9HYPO|nr:glycosyltransferase family 90 protein [Trichoderma citrinoviride]PTB62029.1 glycosyltransferase family 90 protein [Trichoderma citrinoviride]
MWLPRVDDAGPVAGFAGAALLFATVAHWLSSPESEMYSEVVCWAVLPVVIRSLNKPQPNRSLSRPVVAGKSRTTSSTTAMLWGYAANIAIYTFFKTEAGLIQFIPALTPLLLTVKRYRGSDSGSKPPELVTPLVNTYWGPILAGSFCVLTFSDWSIRAFLLCIIPTCFLFIVYTTLLPRVETSTHLPSISFDNAIRPLSARVVILLLCIWGIDTIFFGLTATVLTSTFLIGLLKALSWYFVIQVARDASWVAAPLISTFSISFTNNPMNESTDFQAIAYVLVSIISLGQLIALLPRQAKLRLALWAFGLASLIPLLLNIWLIRDAQQSAKAFGPQKEHPVETLVRSGKANFKSLLQRQSGSYAEAVEAYRRRYDAAPPPGFEEWYEFAVRHNSPIIDDFDAIHRAVSPFWELSGRRVSETLNQIHFAQNSEMWFCSVDGASATTDCTHAYRTFDRHLKYLLDRLFQGLDGALPDVKFLVNHFDEPRILLPTWGAEEARNHPQFNITDLSRRPIWDEITKFCASKEEGSKAKAKQSSIQTFGLPFVTDHPSAMDLCEHPEYRNMHGLFMSPVSFSLVEGLIPALSTGSPSTMGDILLPSPAYIEGEFTYDDSKEIGWEQKRNNLYWAGSTTGGFATDANWSSYQRQRFVKLAQNLEHGQYYYLREIRGVIQRVASSFLNGRLFDVAFTRIFQCERRYCRDQRRFFKPAGWADKDKALRSRLVFDIDGNGISGRYYKLLASKSAPMKQTLLREWHDDRLVPWVHYIPVSQSLEELPELVFYLTSTEAGQKRAREIAEQGRDWFFKALREEDMAVYMYRLLLELARLQDTSREAGSA